MELLEAVSVFFKMGGEGGGFLCIGVVWEVCCKNETGHEYGSDMGERHSPCTGVVLTWTFYFSYNIMELGY